jgi:hypothetical protein
MLDPYGTSNYLLEGTADDVAKAKLADRKLLSQFQAVERLTDEVTTPLYAFLTKRQLQTLVR